MLLKFMNLHAAPCMLTNLELHYNERSLEFITDLALDWYPWWNSLSEKHTYIVRCNLPATTFSWTFDHLLGR